MGLKTTFYVVYITYMREYEDVKRHSINCKHSKMGLIDCCLSLSYRYDILKGVKNIRMQGNMS